MVGSGDYGRISPKLHAHRKSRLAGNAALGLWVKAISFSKAHHNAGYIKTEDALSLGTSEECTALVDAGFWDVVDGGYRFHDWNDVYADERLKVGPLKMVWECLPPGFPNAVHQKLAEKVAELIDEGVESKIIRKALAVWAETPNAGPGFLPWIVSDLVRDDSSIESVLDAAFESGDIGELVRRGYSFSPADPPPGLSVSEMREWMFVAKRMWIEELRRGVVAA